MIFGMTATSIAGSIKINYVCNIIIYLGTHKLLRLKEIKTFFVILVIYHINKFVPSYGF